MENGNAEVKDDNQETGTDKTPRAGISPKRKKLLILGVVVVVIAVAAIAYCLAVIPQRTYAEASKQFDDGNYAEAARLFERLGNYEDAPELADESVYEQARQLASVGDNDGARTLFATIPDYKDVAERIASLDMKDTYAKYADVIEKLDGTTWYYSAGGSARLGEITFDSKGETTEDAAHVKEVKLDADVPGTTQGHTTVVSEETTSYVIDDSSITIERRDGSKDTIPYEVSGDDVSLVDGYFTADQVKEALQGYWSTSDDESMFGSLTSEYYAQIDGDRLVAENSSESVWGNGTYYYGPTTYEYDLECGYFDLGTGTTRVMDLFWGWSIFNGRPILYYSDNACTRFDGPLPW